MIGSVTNRDRSYFKSTFLESQPLHWDFYFKNMNALFFFLATLAALALLTSANPNPAAINPTWSKNIDRFSRGLERMKRFGGKIRSTFRRPIPVQAVQPPVQPAQSAFQYTPRK